jgi:GNAT superfamily N-acetyltransferase
MRTENCEIRRATMDDLDRLLELETLAFLEIGARDYGAATVREILDQVQMISPALIAEGHYFMITEDGQVVASGGWSRSVPGYATATGGGTAALKDKEAIMRAIYTRPDRTRRGLGRRMVTFIEGDAKAHGVERMTLTATLPGLPLYLALGYSDLGPDSATLRGGETVRLRSMARSIVRNRRELAA